MLNTVGVVVALVVSIVGLVVQLVAVGVYVGKLEGFKTLVDYRFKSLEVKQDKHNNLIERMTRVEGSTKSAHHRLDGLEGANGNIRQRN